MMLTTRERATRILKRMALPTPRQDRTLKVVVPPRVIPSHGIRCLCSHVASYAWRAAHENGCTRIQVHDGPHVHEFDTIDLFRALVKKRLGFVPGVKRINGQVPRFLATRGHLALGNTFDTSRTLYRVPVDVSATPVSGDPGRAEVH